MVATYTKYIFILVLVVIIRISRLIGLVFGRFCPKPSGPTLVTLTFSHYCEKVRWALDSCKYQNYCEETHPPLLHLPFTFFYSSGGESCTPILRLQDRTIQQSSAIIRYISQISSNNAWLYPCQEVYDLERYFDEELGPHSRKIFYYYTFNTTQGQKVVNELFARHYEYKYEHWLSRILQPYTIIIMTRRLKLTEEETARSIEKVKAVWARTNQLLSDGRKYLVNNTFTAADITLAALAYGLVLPPEMEHIRYSPEFAAVSLPHELYRIVEECRNSVTGQYVLRMYREHRGVKDFVRVKQRHKNCCSY